MWCQDDTPLWVFVHVCVDVSKWMRKLLRNGLDAEMRRERGVNIVGCYEHGTRHGVRIIFVEIVTRTRFTKCDYMRYACAYVNRMVCIRCHFRAQFSSWIHTLSGGTGTRYMLASMKSNNAMKRCHQIYAKDDDILWNDNGKFSLPTTFGGVCVCVYGVNMALDGERVRRSSTAVLPVAANAYYTMQKCVCIRLNNE